MKAWIENGVVRDVCQGNPEECYHPDVAVHYNTDVPDGTTNGATLVDGVWTNPVVNPVEAMHFVHPVAPAAPTTEVSPVEFKLRFTAQERVAIRKVRASDDFVDDFFDILDDPRLTKVDLTLQSTKDAVAYLALAGYITPERASEILGTTDQPA